MDQYPPAPKQQNLTPNVPNDTVNRFHGLVSWKVGLLEFFLGIIVLFLVLATLNYFNILKISSAFPDQLGWLPHQSQQKPTNLPTSYTPAVFNYNTQKAKALVTNYIKDVIKPELLPSKIEVKQGLSSGNVIEDVKYEFGASFGARDSTVSANFVYKENSDIPEAYGIFIRQKNSKQATATATLSNSLLTSYFLNPYIVSNCQAKGSSSSCENFQDLNDGKKGYGIHILGNSTTLFTCFLPKDSKYYQEAKSCIKL